MELTPENCNIVSTVIREMCPKIGTFSNGVTYESIYFGSYPHIPSKEEFQIRLDQVVKQNTLKKEIESKPITKLRQERNRRLADADWVTLRAYSSGTDVPEEWMTYMQALRDLPSTTKDPTNPVWPEPPNPSLVGEKMEKLAPRVSFLETSVASLISLDKQLNYKNAEMEILDIKVKNIESRLGMIEETLTSILSKLNI